MNREIDSNNPVLRYLCNLFEKPAGTLGRLAGHVMATRPSNRERNLWTLELLDLQRDDRILEVGFGPGFALANAARLAPKGFLAGFDHSEVMVKMACQRNRETIASGRMKLLLGSVADPPFHEKEYFDKIYTVNTYMFWPDPVVALKKLHPLLRPNGRIAITHQPKKPGATEKDTEEARKDIFQALAAAGFQRIEARFKNIRPVAVVCVLADK